MKKLKTSFLAAAGALCIATAGGAIACLPAAAEGLSYEEFQTQTFQVSEGKTLVSLWNDENKTESKNANGTFSYAFPNSGWGAAYRYDRPLTLDGLKLTVYTDYETAKEGARSGICFTGSPSGGYSDSGGLDFIYYVQSGDQTRLYANSSHDFAGGTNYFYKSAEGARDKSASDKYTNVADSYGGVIFSHVNVQYSLEFNLTAYDNVYRTTLTVLNGNFHDVLGLGGAKQQDFYLNAKDMTNLTDAGGKTYLTLLGDYGDQKPSVTVAAEQSVEPTFSVVCEGDVSFGTALADLPLKAQIDIVGSPSVDVPLSDCTVTGYDPDTAGRQTLTVTCTYQGKPYTARVEITVLAQNVQTYEEFATQPYTPAEGNVLVGLWRDADKTVNKNANGTYSYDFPNAGWESAFRYDKPLTLDGLKITSYTNYETYAQGARSGFCLTGDPVGGYSNSGGLNFIYYVQASDQVRIYATNTHDSQNGTPYFYNTAAGARDKNAADKYKSGADSRGGLIVTRVNVQYSLEFHLTEYANVYRVTFAVLNGAIHEAAELGNVTQYDFYINAKDEGLTDLFDQNGNTYLTLLGDYGGNAGLSVTVAAEQKNTPVLQAIAQSDYVERGTEQSALPIGVKLSFPSGAQTDLDFADCVVTGYRKDTLGEQTLTLTCTYDGAVYSAQVSITVAWYSLNVTTQRLFVERGTAAHDLPLAVQVVFPGRDPVEINYAACTVTGYDADTVGAQTITVSCSYQGENYSQEVTIEVVDAKTITGKLTTAVSDKRERHLAPNLLAARTSVVIDGAQREINDLTITVSASYTVSFKTAESSVVDFSPRLVLFRDGQSEIFLQHRIDGWLGIYRVPDGRTANDAYALLGKQFGAAGHAGALNVGDKPSYNVRLEGKKLSLSVNGTKYWAELDLSEVLAQSDYVFSPEVEIVDTSYYKIKDVALSAITSDKFENCVVDVAPKGAIAGEYNKELTAGMFTLTMFDGTAHDVDFAADERIAIKAGTFDKTDVSEQNVIFVYDDGGLRKEVTVSIVLHDAEVSVDVQVLGELLWLGMSENELKEALVVVFTTKSGAQKYAQEYTVSAFDGNATTEQQITVTAGALSKQVTLTLNDAIASVLAQTQKTNVTVGTPLTIADFVVTVNWRSGKTEQVSDARLTGYNAMRAGEQNAVISYRGHLCEVKITVQDKLKAMRLIAVPVKTAYEKGEELDLTGIKVEAEYYSGNVVVLGADDLAQMSVAGYQKNGNGTQTVRLGMEGLTVTFEVHSPAFEYGYVLGGVFLALAAAGCVAVAVVLTKKKKQK